MTVDKLLIAPAERVDIIVDFERHAVKRIVLKNDAPALFPNGGMVIPAQLMQFRVGTRLTGKDTSTIPAKLATVERINPKRKIILVDSTI